MALASYLRRNGKKTSLVNRGPFDRHEICDFSDRFDSAFPEECDAIVVLDFSEPSRGGIEIAPNRPIAVIDHHLGSTAFGDVRFVEPSAPSCAVLVQSIIEATDQLTKEEAEWLLLATMGDTGFLRHIELGATPLLLSLAALNEAGASFHMAYQALYSGFSLPTYHLMGRHLQRITAHCGGKFIITWESREDRNQLGAKIGNSNMLYQFLTSIKGCVIAAFIRERDRGCSAGLRSPQCFDVHRVAERFGGGGHRYASGFRSDLSVPELKKKLISYVSELLS